MVRFPRITFVDRLPELPANCIALAGTTGALLRIARARRTVRVSHALLPYTSDADPLTEDDRDALWEAFGVPIFEHFHDEYGKLIAVECDAHEGLHLVDDTTSDEDPCPCGKPGARIRIPEPQLP